MLLWCVDSWDTPLKVRQWFSSYCAKNHPYYEVSRFFASEVFTVHDSRCSRIYFFAFQQSHLAYAQ